MIRPPRLREGDLVAALSPSWGGPSVFPHVFDLGLQNVRDVLGVRVREYETTRWSAEALGRSPQARAEDLHRAFADPEVKAIFASIGGDDSIRVLPHLDLDLIRANPKIVMGFSDTAAILTLLNQRGLVTFNGPAIMAGFAQMRHRPASFSDHVRQMLMEPAPEYRYEPYAEWSGSTVPWETPGYDGEVTDLRPHDGWHWLQGRGKHRGRLFGGCMPVVGWLKGTPFWPDPEFWEERILFLETSEDEESVDEVGWDLRNYGAMGALDRIAGLLYGRPAGYSDEQKRNLDERILRVVSEEFGRKDLPILTNLDFGHTDPQWVLPLGVLAEIDCDARTFGLVEPAVE